MKNKKTKEEVMNEKALPIIQHATAIHCIQFLSKNIAELSKTQPDATKRKGMESDIECLWYALEIINSYKSLFATPDERTSKAVLDISFKDAFEPQSGYRMTRKLIEYLAEIVVETSSEFSDRRETLEGHLNVLWVTLEIMHTCRGFFQDPDESSEKLAA